MNFAEDNIEQFIIENKDKFSTSDPSIYHANRFLLKVKNKNMNEKEMFEQSFKRPSNFFKLDEERRWEIDKELGILDWVGNNLTEEEKIRFKNHYKKIKS